MPKTKDIEIKKIRNRIVDEEEKVIDPDIVLEDEEGGEVSDEESTTLDIDEIDPFGDKWEQ
ncbi:MAG: hypothetical protein AAB637_00295 [Patescibacteria group bacterium]